MKSEKIINKLYVCLFALFIGSCSKQPKKVITKSKITSIKEAAPKALQINKPQNIPIAPLKVEKKTLPKKEIPLKKDPEVKILLDKYSSNDYLFKPFFLQSSKGFSISSNTSIKPLMVMDKLEIKRTKNLILILNCSTKKVLSGKEFHLTSPDNHFTLNNTKYQGSLSLIMDSSNNLLLINKIKLSDYLYSVLRYEIIQSWDMEMQKVQAVASRTYALYHILNARKQGRAFDLKNTTQHQTYKGTHEFTHLRQAINETDNLILTYKNKPALTMFDACCGGIIPAHMETDIFISAPYLARKAICNYCQKCFTYNWKFELHPKDLITKLSDHRDLKNQVKSIGQIRNIKVVKKDKAGLVKEVHLVGDKKSITLPGKKIQSALKPKLKSCTFNIKDIPHPKLSRTFNFEGKGLGHHLGLCQQGARELVKRGWSHKKILSFYYPGTLFGKLESFL